MMMQRRVLARSFAVTARLRGDASETMYGHGDWKNTDPEFVLARSKDEHIAKLKDIDGWVAGIKADMETNKASFEQKRAASRYTVLPLIQEPRVWETSSVAEAAYFWPRQLTNNAIRYKEVNLQHKRLEEFAKLKYYFYIWYAMLVAALLINVPEYAVYVWYENRA